MNLIRKFLSALWSIFKRNVRTAVAENGGKIREQIVKDVKEAAQAARE